MRLDPTIATTTPGSPIDPCATVRCVPVDTWCASNSSRITPGRGHHPPVYRDAHAFTLPVPARTIDHPAAGALWPRPAIAAPLPTWARSSRSYQRPRSLHTQQRDVFRHAANTAIRNIAVITLIQCP